MIPPFRVKVNVGMKNKNFLEISTSLNVAANFVQKNIHMSTQFEIKT